MNKKGMQIIFTYIIIAVLIGFVIYFGFFTIQKLRDFNDKAEMKSFENDFDKIVQNVYNLDVGSRLEYSKYSSNKPLSVPENVERICVTENKITFNFKDGKKDYFVVRNLDGNSCFDTLKGFSFVLENKVVNENVVVEIKNVE